ncbi:MAG: hypothetical protein HZA54_13025 [Planctomycetes bacterium]|nr:hypothetical protein [Planctomycetota bacterium]
MPASRGAAPGRVPDPAAAAAARRIFQFASPWEAEAELDRARRRLLDELDFGHDFDLDRLALYQLKLLLAERRAAFDAVRGRRLLGEILEGTRARLRALIAE